MNDVAIIGAGELGGTLAHVLARGDAAHAIRLLDETRTVAVGKALDIMQAAPIERFHTVVSGGRDLLRAAGATVVVIADQASGTEWTGDDGIALLGRIVRTTPGAIFLCAGATQRELVERGVRELGVRRERLLGSAPEALVGALRAIVGLEAKGSPKDVALSVLGVPPDKLIVPWDEATIAGLGITRVLDVAARRRVEGRVPALWPPGPLALASAAARVTEAFLTGSRRVVSAFVAPDDTYGRRAKAAALPVRLRAEGLLNIELVGLSARDRVALDNAMLL
jgi:malate dehydrogenase